MSRAAWSFVHYACGHSTPVRGGDRKIPTPCPDCKANQKGTQQK